MEIINNIKINFSFKFWEKICGTCEKTYGWRIEKYIKHLSSIVELIKKLNKANINIDIEIDLQKYFSLSNLNLKFFSKTKKIKEGNILNNSLILKPDEVTLLAW